jgi:hypothetical protein
MAPDLSMAAVVKFVTSDSRGRKTQKPAPVLSQETLDRFERALSPRKLAILAFDRAAASDDCSSLQLTT